MRYLTAFAGLAMLALATGAQADSLNKCIDAEGKVTYSNLPCRNAQEVRSVEIDPAPPAPATTRARPSLPAQDAQPAAHDAPATVHLETGRTAGKPAPQPSQRQCDTIADKLGKVLDKMDQARRQGYTQKQVDAWNAEIRELERKKQQAGCF